MMHEVEFCLINLDRIHSQNENWVGIGGKVTQNVPCVHGNECEDVGHVLWECSA